LLGDRLSAESSNQTIAWTPPRLGDEPFRRGLGSGAKITMPAASNPHEVLGRLDHGIPLRPMTIRQPKLDCRLAAGTCFAA
jgi:hypothetical protein